MSRLALLAFTSLLVTALVACGDPPQKVGSSPPPQQPSTLPADHPPLDDAGLPAGHPTVPDDPHQFGGASAGSRTGRFEGVIRVPEALAAGDACLFVSIMPAGRNEPVYSRPVYLAELEATPDAGQVLVPFVLSPETNMMGVAALPDGDLELVASLHAGRFVESEEIARGRWPVEIDDLSIDVVLEAGG